MAYKKTHKIDKYPENIEISGEKHILLPENKENIAYQSIYSFSDIKYFIPWTNQVEFPVASMKTLDELIEKDKQREKDGFPRRIKLGKLIKPGKGNKSKVVIVPTTQEPKFYHDNSISDDEEGQGQSTGGSGEGEEGEVIGEQPIDPQEGEGEGTGAGQGSGGEHDMMHEAFDLGRVLTEKFQLPNLKNKGAKRSFTKYIYELTDRNRGFGQVLDKKATLKKIIETNILLGNIKPGEPFSTENLMAGPTDFVYRIMSKEKDFESQAIVFFVRDYSGSMSGKPTEVVTQQHLLIYSWLMYQYENKVETRFIVHDTNAKEVPDFYSYYKYSVAGGTNIYPAFDLVNKIVEEENLIKDYNIYVFQGTDGDDWETNGEKMLKALNKILTYVSRMGITVAKNSWTGSGTKTTVERNIERSGVLKEKPELIRLDSFSAANASESRLIDGIKQLLD